MLDLVYQTLNTLLSKDNQGYVTPTEFDRIADLVQKQIFRGYFEDENRDKIRQNKGVSNKGYANLPRNIRERITQFAATASIPKLAGVYNLPADLYFIEDDGITLSTNGRVVEEMERRALGYANKSSLSKPSEVYPSYEQIGDTLLVSPNTIVDNLICRYLREPKSPRWTYFILPNNEVKYDPTNPSFQDFELHSSEFVNIVLRMSVFFGLTIREEEVIQVSQALKEELKQSDES